MDAIILAGGKGERLKTITKDQIPKSLANVGKSPIIFKVLDNALNFRVTKFVICVCHLKDQIINLLGFEYKGVPINYSIEDKPLGTGGAVKRALNFVKGNAFFVFNADSYISLKNQSLYSYEKFHNIIYAVKLEDSSRFGSIEIDEYGMIKSFLEKDTNKSSGLINAGIYKLNREIFSNIAQNIFSLEKLVFPMLVSEEKLYCIEINSTFIDIGTPEDYRKSFKFNFNE
jgi:D-glycero-alpha-D-manno-heptose 1-phosphate guanylyltransferase